MRKNLFAICIATTGILYAVLAVIILLLCWFTEIPLLIGVVVSAVIIVLQFLLGPFLTDLTMKWFYRIRFGAELPDYLKLFITDICAEKNMKYPKIGVINDGGPNAFTYGRTKNSARIVLTRGIFDLLSEDEVKAVVAHEMGHACHYDMLFMTVVQLVPFVLYTAAEILLRTNSESSSGDSEGKNYAAVFGLVCFVLYYATQYIILWLSRNREYYADQFAAQVTKNPNALASALVKIGFGLSTQSEKKGKSGTATSSNTLGIFDAHQSKSMVVSCFRDGEVQKSSIRGAMKWEMWNVWAKWYELNSTHPLISKRLLALSEQSPEYGQAPFIEFNLQKPESYVDDFFREVAIMFCPWILLIVGLIVGLVNREQMFFWFGLFGILAMLGFLFKFLYTHPNRNYPERTVEELLQEVKVSGITSIPCTLNGTVIGRGDPGCIFSEDFILQDRTGIVFLDYNQPLFIINKIFALFKAKKVLDRTIVAKGWYRRSPVPFVELYTMEVDGKTKKCYTYIFGIVLRVILLAAFAALFALTMLKIL